MEKINKDKISILYNWFYFIFFAWSWNVVSHGKSKNLSIPVDIGDFGRRRQGKWDIFDQWFFLHETLKTPKQPRLSLSLRRRGWFIITTRLKFIFFLQLWFQNPSQLLKIEEFWRNTQKRERPRSVFEQSKITHDSFFDFWIDLRWPSWDFELFLWF